MKWVLHSKLIVEKVLSKETLSPNQNEFIRLVEGVSLFNYKTNVTNRLFCYNKMSDKEKKNSFVLIR